MLPFPLRRYRTYLYALLFSVVLTACSATSPLSAPTEMVPTAATPLQNGVAVTRLGGDTGANRFYALKVPNGARNLSVSLAGGTGNADLYGRSGSAPSTTTYDCRPYLPGNSERCAVSIPRAGTYYVMVRARTPYAGAQLVARYQLATAANVVDVYVLWGQSNARGRAPLAELPAHLRGPLAGVYLWNGSAYAPLEAKVNSNYPQAGLDWGLELQFGYLLRRNNPGKPVYLVKHSVGGTPLLPTSGTTWNPLVTGSLYAQAKASLSKALATLQAQGKVPTVKGFVWVQGGADAVAGVKSAYTTRQSELFKGVRAFVGDPALPIIDLYVRGEAYDETDVNAAKTAVAGSLGGVRLLKADAFEDIGDNRHFDGAANLAAGRHLFEGFSNKRYPLPSGLPAPVWDLDLSRQENWQLDGLMRVKRVYDVSGNNRHFAAATTATPPVLLEGPVGQGFGVVRSAGLQSLAGPRTPLPAGAAYTSFAVVGKPTNTAAAGVRVVIGSDDRNGPDLVYSGGSFRLRHGPNDVLVSPVLVGTEPRIVVATYDAAGNNTLRVNGVMVATGGAVLPYTGGGSVQVLDARGDPDAAQLDLARVGTFGQALTTAQAERLEGYLAHRFGVPLPVTHPYHRSPPA